MGHRNVLHPAQIDRVIHMVLLVDISTKDWHYQLVHRCIDLRFIDYNRPRLLPCPTGTFHRDQCSIEENKLMKSVGIALISVSFGVSAVMAQPGVSVPV